MAGWCRKCWGPKIWKILNEGSRVRDPLRRIFPLCSALARPGRGSIGGTYIGPDLMRTPVTQVRKCILIMTPKEETDIMSNNDAKTDTLYTSSYFFLLYSTLLYSTLLYSTLLYIILSVLRGLGSSVSVLYYQDDILTVSPQLFLMRRARAVQI